LSQTGVGSDTGTRVTAARPSAGRSWGSSAPRRCTHRSRVRAAGIATRRSRVCRSRSDHAQDPRSHPQCRSAHGGRRGRRTRSDSRTPASAPAWCLGAGRRFRQPGTPVLRAARHLVRRRHGHRKRHAREAAHGRAVRRRIRPRARRRSRCRQPRTRVRDLDAGRPGEGSGPGAPGADRSPRHGEGQGRPAGVGARAQPRRAEPGDRLRVEPLRRSCAAAPRAGGRRGRERPHRGALRRPDAHAHGLPELHRRRVRHASGEHAGHLRVRRGADRRRDGSRRLPLRVGPRRVRAGPHLQGERPHRRDRAHVGRAAAAHRHRGRQGRHDLRRVLRVRHPAADPRHRRRRRHRPGTDRRRAGPRDDCGGLVRRRDLPRRRQRVCCVSPWCAGRPATLG